ncbi:MULTISPECIES: lasso peptide biosynthesis PqqD family chaperone [Bacillus cereus group]|uniref:PqqD family protein n=1 Tax=Bacillus cereus TaxID=1396 RepID=A0A2B8SZ82_BACCE|nr:lasso peptide biosynthesis PqqD family chaperone [Bacillus cereus]PDY84787.1 PqqD family protein [Bacillus cereus]PFA14809.1 PqqD family protein [Bacillus cereus]PFM38825.1 PqqD family protein [Bacillus cereus]PGL62667.1 PqqD family protein [Bacillus cereus]PGQ12427.1 PqqD family protein [Bacillus cereus]
MIKKQAILLNQCVAQVKGNVVSDMDGEKVMLSIKNGKYYNLGRMGGVIWELIEKPISVTQLVTTLISEYKVEQSQCEGQVVSFLEMLLEEGLVVIE